MSDVSIKFPTTQIQTGIIAEFFRREPLFAGTALFLVLIMIPTLLAMQLDTREFLGINVWIKPLKFQIALVVYMATLAWFAGWLPSGMREKRSYKIFTKIVVFCIFMETIWTGTAASFATASHFNRANIPLEILYAFMGIFAVTLTAATLVYGLAILRDNNSALNPAFQNSVALGLILTFVLTVPVAGYLSSGTSHLVGGNLSDAESSLLMGWARDGGDLRVAHFFSTHAMHFIPLVGYIASRKVAVNAAKITNYSFALFYTALIGYTFYSAVMGKPFLPELI